MPDDLFNIESTMRLATTYHVAFPEGEEPERGHVVCDALGTWRNLYVEHDGKPVFDIQRFMYAVKFGLYCGNGVVVSVERFKG